MTLFSREFTETLTPTPSRVTSVSMSPSLMDGRTSPTIQQRAATFSGPHSVAIPCDSPEKPAIKVLVSVYPLYRL
jgi:hypothetical protein